MTLIERKALIADFLDKCNRYADRMLEGYRQELAHASGRRILEIQDKIGHWTAYRAFNEHTIEELGTDMLDDWLEAPGHE